MCRKCVLVPAGRPFPWALSILLVFAWTAAARASAVDVGLVSDRRGTLPLFEAGADGRHDTYRAYVEAVKGEPYGIRIRNNTPGRVGVVVAVDGRNIISGGKSDLRNHERMYILAPWESAVYDGWRTARDTVNRFYFTHPGDSYAGAFGDHSAMGVIAVAVYRERESLPPRRHRQREREYPDREGRGGALEPSPERAEEGGREKRSPGIGGDAAGTGFGRETYSPSIRVRFSPEPRTAERHFIKYEWRDTLCRKGILDCRWSRFPDDGGGFAPYPPRWDRTRFE